MTETVSVDSWKKHCFLYQYDFLEPLDQFTLHHCLTAGIPSSIIRNASQKVHKIVLQPTPSLLPLPHHLYGY